MIHFLKKLVPRWIKNGYHLKMAFLASIWYGFPARHLKVIGVTGTDGKTTTANMIACILEVDEKRVALASTVCFRIRGEEWTNVTKMTTSSSFAVQKFLRQAVTAGCEWMVLEVSSHSLDQNRLWGIHFDIAVLTNITREHLDYHKTMEKYRRAKRKLFERADKIVLNEALSHIEEFLSVSARREITYGTSPRVRKGSEEYVVAEEMETRFGGSSFVVRGEAFSLQLPGVFNIENALAAISTSELAGVKLPICAKALSGMKGVPGRMESVPNNWGIEILIDYAVTPEALRRVYSLISSTHPEGNIIAVFGACGERDRGKRPIMGEIVDLYADSIILTNEDPYYEEPHRILDEIAKGIVKKEENKGFFKIFDRREAIIKALTLAKKGDTVVITGKGAEETMYTKGIMTPWNDRRVVEELLKNGV